MNHLLRIALLVTDHVRALGEGTRQSKLVKLKDVNPGLHKLVARLLAAD